MNKKVLLFLIYFIISTTICAQELIKVGIYENAPKLFLNKQNQPSGFFVDILNDIAIKENWKLNYIQCEWSECLAMLEDGKLDIMPDVAYTKQREERFLFSNESVLSSWSVLYKHKNIKIDSILDLKNKKIAVLKDSIQAKSLKKTLDSFDIKPLLYNEVSSFSQAFALLAKGEVDCVSTNRFYELSHPLENNVLKTNIITEPSMIKFGFNSSKKNLAQRVDFHLKQLKEDHTSSYYVAQTKWITPKENFSIPQWVLWVFALSIIIIIFLVILVLIFKKIVYIKTKELLQKEELMIIQSKHAAMGEMVSMITHQWRQPLSVINMSANNIRLSLELKEKITEQQLLEHTQTVADEVKHLSDTIDDFRNFFKPNKNKRKIAISEIINEVKKILEISLRNNNIEFIIHNDENYEIETFTNELLQVVLNIINNAKDILKEKNTPSATITLTTLQTDKSYEIAICDNGGGIPKEIFHSIGKEYFTTKGDNGTGLGLYMSILIVKQHLNGSLKWYNTEDGACFKITIAK